MVRGSSKKEEGNKTRLQARVISNLVYGELALRDAFSWIPKGWVCLFVSKLGRPFSYCYCIVSYDSFRRFYSFILGGKPSTLVSPPSFSQESSQAFPNPVCDLPRKSLQLVWVTGLTIH